MWFLFLLNGENSKEPSCAIFFTALCLDYPGIRSAARQSVAAMALYIVTGPPFTGKKTLLMETFKRLQASTTYCYMRVVSTRVDPSPSGDGSSVPKPEVDANFEVAVSESDFVKHRELGRFSHVWADTRPKEPPVYFGIPTSLGHALQDGKKVVIFIALPQHRMVISDLEALYSPLAPIHLVIINAATPTVIARVKTVVVSATNAQLAAGGSGGGVIGAPGTGSTVGAAGRLSSPASSTRRALPLAAAASADAPAGPLPPPTPPSGPAPAAATATTSSSSSSSSASSTAASASLSAAVPASLLTSGSALGIGLLVGAPKLDEKLALVKKRLVKLMQELEPLSAVGTVVNNDGSVEEGTAALLAALSFQGEADFADRLTATAGASAGAGGPRAGSRGAALHLQTCPAQEYLEHTVFPALVPALETLDVLRPSDPVEYLAMLLLKQDQTVAAHVAQHRALEQIRAALRAQVVAERIDNAETGRI
jgi:ribose 1,5-bisphosphokinase PhnN